MRNFYIFLAVGFILAILMFASSFIYLDKEKHQTYVYALRLDDRDIGATEVNKYITDEKTIYKSSATIPFSAPFTETKSRLVLNKKRLLESYQKESSGDRGQEIFLLENKNNLASCVATFQAQFFTFKDEPIREGTFFLDLDAPATFMPIIDSYDFRKGRVQAFAAFVRFANDLPPIKKVITLTSIRDEYIKVDRKYIKSECLIFKARGLPQATIWVAKSDRSLIRMEMPSKHLTLTRTRAPKKLEAKDIIFSDGSYSAQEVSFKSGDIELAGTLATPAGDGKFPAILLVGGSAPYDRNCNGLFSTISDRLAKTGFCALRFDQRGIGASKGSYDEATDSEAIADAAAAFDYLASQSQVDPARIVIVGHADGAGYAAKLAAAKENTAALVLMAPLMQGAELVTGNQNLPDLAGQYGWGVDYLNFARNVKEQSVKYVNNITRKWTSILANRCYLEKMRNRLTERGMDTVKTIKIPVLILQGNDDDVTAPAYAASLNKALEESGNKAHNLFSFDRLGHFFGQAKCDGEHRIYHNVDPIVSDMIRQWTGQLFADMAARQAKALPPQETAPTLEEVLGSTQNQPK